MALAACVALPRDSCSSCGLQHSRAPLGLVPSSSSLALVCCKQPLALAFSSDSISTAFSPRHYLAPPPLNPCPKPPSLALVSSPKLLRSCFCSLKTSCLALPTAHDTLSTHPRDITTPPTHHPARHTPCLAALTTPHSTVQSVIHVVIQSGTPPRRRPPFATAFCARALFSPPPRALIGR